MFTFITQFFRPSLDTILKDFHKTISKLESFEANAAAAVRAKWSKINWHHEQIDSHEADVADLNLQRSTAQATADNLRKLITPSSS